LAHMLLKNNMHDYVYKERVAIKMDSYIEEREAIIQTKREITEPECLMKAKALQDRMKFDHAAKMAKTRKFTYE
jgi:hypothetical protein